jgi:hypothetical protein
MKTREHYHGFVIDVTVYDLRDGGFTSHFNIEKHDASGATVTHFETGQRFETHQAALEAGLQLGRNKVDARFDTSDSGIRSRP